MAVDLEVDVWDAGGLVQPDCRKLYETSIGNTK